jgi:hypothetical protein
MQVDDVCVTLHPVMVSSLVPGALVALALLLALSVFVHARTRDVVPVDPTRPPSR